MFQSVDSPYLVPYDGSFRVPEGPTAPPEGAPSKEQCKRRLKELVDELDDLQRMTLFPQSLASFIDSERTGGRGVYLGLID